MPTFVDRTALLVAGLICCGLAMLFWRTLGQYGFGVISMLYLFSRLSDIRHRKLQRDRASRREEA
ncbi:MAG: hypothetical protein GY851_16525 [bacterium]|nr:hypothetical protein [bacterium]